ncbi:MAG: hypothetical protein DMD77_13980 [Candidatus Rokuibacteriota bacterium]|nr:MAG: hypothetical protein DMD77_13980 [Candidatus Rokubacteria bacterium]
MRVGVVALLVTQIVGVTALGAGMPRADTMVDSEIRALVRVGRARVLVTLQVAETSDPAQRADAIGRAQDAVLARLPSTHASVVRRYESIPMLALEIDATALRALETMTDLVAGVKLDRAVKPQ